MDFGLSEEQRLLQESLRRHLETEMPIARVREIAAREDAFDAKSFAALAEMGVLGILVPEAFGGSGLGLLDAVAAAEELGRGIAPVPFLGTSVLAAIALREAGTKEQQGAWLPGIAAGRTRVGVAATELFGRREGAGFRVEGSRLRGRGLLALDGAADAFLIPVGHDRLALVPRDARGLAVTPMTTIDRTRRFAEIEADGVEGFEWIGGDRDAGHAIRRMIDAGRVVVAADVLGACESALERSVRYAAQRIQFGRPIGSFQAVKHLCAEMVAELEPARSLVWYAAHAFDALPEESTQLAAHAKAHLCEIGTTLVRTATEVHGGIGFTAEHDLHLYFKRVGVDRQLLGSPDVAREDAARAQGWSATTVTATD